MQKHTTYSTKEKTQMHIIIIITVVHSWEEHSTGSNHTARGMAGNQI